MRALALTAALVAAALAAIAATAGGAGADRPDRPGLEGTIWVGNRASTTNAVAAFDAATGEPLATLDLAAPASDLASGKRRIFVGEESANQIAVIEDGAVVGRIATSARPHHLASGSAGDLIVYGAFGSPRVGLIDARDATLVGEWQASASDAARVHAAALSRDGRTIYTANDVTSEIGVVAVGSGLVRTIPVERAHEVVVSANERYLYVAARAANRMRVVDLATDRVVSELELPIPDTLELSANGKQLTVGLRSTNPARLAVLDVDDASLSVRAIVDLPGTLAGHQWTSKNGRWTFAAFEGTEPGVAVVDHRTDEVVDVLPFPGNGPRQPHGITYAPPSVG
jgi:DNA-binding beta-propeller fold protein YncE